MSYSLFRSRLSKADGSRQAECWLEAVKTPMMMWQRNDLGGEWIAGFRVVGLGLRRRLFHANVAVRDLDQGCQLARELRGQLAGAQAPGPVPFRLTGNVHAGFAAQPEDILHRVNREVGDRGQRAADECPMHSFAVANA